MRLAHFIHRYPPAVGGSESYFARLSEHCASLGDEVTVFTTTALDLDAFWDRRARQFPPGTETINNVNVRRCPLWHLPFLHRYVLKALSLVPVPSWQAITMPYNPIVPAMWSIPERFDAVHASAFPYSFPLMCAWRLASRLRVPFFLTPFVHTGDPRNPADAIRRAYTTPALVRIAKAADRVFVQTEGERRALASRGVDESRLVLQGLGVDLSSCTHGDRQAIRAAWNVGDDVVIGHLANHSHEKGTIDLIEAMQRLWAEGTNAHLVLAGPQMPAFRDYWAALSQRGPIHLLGVLDEPGKRDFFAGIDVFALPSRSDSFGLVLPEAWANGVPNVVYEAGGPPWIVRHGLDGLIVPCGDIGALAGALRRLIADSALRQRLGEAGKSRLGEFDWGEKLALVRAHYALEASGGRKPPGVAHVATPPLSRV
jgi:glycosyltransferase involved in cell wall biosynthesis